MVKEEEERLDREVKTKTLIMSDSTSRSGGGGGGGVTPIYWDTGCAIF